MSSDDTGYTDHISHKFNTELAQVRSNLQGMAALVQQQMRMAIAALVDADREKAFAAIQIDRHVNAMEGTIDTECTKILALHHPAAGDLRLVISITKTVADLERIGDEAVKIARRAIDLCDEGGSPRGDVEIRHIGNVVCIMVQDAMQAFMGQDLALAIKVANTDHMVDLEYDCAVRELATYLFQYPRCISRIMKVMWSLHALERIGDNARNIALAAQYLATGITIREPEPA